jgi:hypothetical protein
MINLPGTSSFISYRTEWIGRTLDNKVIHSIVCITAAHPSPPNYTSVKARPCGVDVQMGLNG